MSALDNAKLDDLCQKLGRGETLTEKEHREFDHLTAEYEREEEAQEERRARNRGLVEFYGTDAPTWDVHGNL